MDIQLQADLLKYHVLYLGYSLSDINVKRIFYLARKRWEQGQTTKASYIVTATPNLLQKEVFQCNDIITFSGRGTDKFERITISYHPPSGNGRVQLIHNGLDRGFNFFDLGVQFPDEPDGVLQFQGFGGHSGANGASAASRISTAISLL